MKCASVSRVLVAALAATSVLVPTLASADDPYDRRDGYYDDRYGDRYDDRYRDGRYDERDRYYGRVRYGDYRYYEDACRAEKRKRRNTGAAVGAVAGATVGSQVAGNGARTEGAVLGAVAGAVIGAEVGRKSAKRSAVCDASGPYWYRQDTRDWRYGERWGHRGRRNDARQGCRWAQDYRGDYFRVCPDRHGRYRIAY